MHASFYTSVSLACMSETKHTYINHMHTDRPWRRLGMGAATIYTTQACVVHNGFHTVKRCEVKQPSSGMQ